MNQNLLKETLQAIANSEHCPEDIVFIGSLHSGHSCTWADFQILANIVYHSGYGAAEVATDLVVVFSDYSYLARDEYDGKEWWVHRPNIILPKERRPIRTLLCDWGHLDEANE